MGNVTAVTYARIPLSPTRRNLCIETTRSPQRWWRQLHNQHDDYLLAPESLFPVFPESAPQKKLTPNLRDKGKYVVHYRNLKLYLQLGLVVIKVHRVLTFKQSPWLKTCIDFNIRVHSLETVFSKISLNW